MVSLNFKQFSLAYVHFCLHKHVKTVLFDPQAEPYQGSTTLDQEKNKQKKQKNKQTNNQTSLWYNFPKSFTMFTNEQQ